MIRQLALAVLAATAVSVPTTNATAQSSASQIHGLQSESDGDADGTSAYTMLYWARALAGISVGSYATVSHYDKTPESIFVVDDPTDLAWARLIRRPATTSINSADDPSRPENAVFFNQPAVTDEHADSPSTFAAWVPSLFTSVPAESTPAANPAVASFVAPSLPGADAWTSLEPGSDSASAPETSDSSPVSSKFSDSAFAPIVDAPDLAVVASPEPDTLALFATGFIGIAAVAIKRKRAGA